MSLTTAMSQVVLTDDDKFKFNSKTDFEMRDRLKTQQLEALNTKQTTKGYLKLKRFVTM